MALNATMTLPAHAQAEPARAAQQQAGAVTGDIVVTAQRREQKVRDVGIALSVLSSKELRALNVTNATDLVRAVPNLKFNAYGSSQVVFNIRGVSQNDYGDQQEPPVAVYQDDSYASSITTASFPVFDLNRAEVLRGPQGTLFGRNATGGAVQFLSNQPGKAFGGYLTGTYGRFNQTIIEGALTGPIAEGLTARISGQYDRDDGYIKDVTPGQPNRGADNHWAMRGIVQWDASPDFKARLTLRYAEADHERQAGMYALAPSCANAQGQGVYLAAYQVCQYWSGYNGNRPGAMATGYANPSITPSQGGYAWATAGTGDPYVDRKQFGSTLRLEGNLGIFSLVSISDYQHLSKFYSEVGDYQPELPYVYGQGSYTPGPCPGNSNLTCYAPGSVFNQGTHLNQYSQEVRASATLGHQFLTFGAFGMVIKGKYTAKYATPFDDYDPNVVFSQRTDSFAFFAQDEWKISDQFKIIGGLRYWHDHKVGDYSASELFDGGSTPAAMPFTMHFGSSGLSYNDPSCTTSPCSWTYGSGVASGITVTPADARPSYSGVTARAEIDYKPGKDTLIYVSYNRGSKSGGFTFSTGTPTLGQSVIDTFNNIPYKPETLDDYEIGLKAKINRMVEINLAAFYYAYHNYQAYTQVGYTQVVRNLPAGNRGVEADLTLHPLRGLTVQTSGSLQQSHVDNVLLPDGVTIVRHDLPQTPTFAGNALMRYEFDLAGGRAALQADSLYTGGFCFTVMCAPVEQEAAYHVENARISFTPAGDRVDLALFVNNLFNRAYRVYAFDGTAYEGAVAGVYAKPRTWGVTATVHFGPR
ncbi:TonB-dependent receptor [Novosphingobium fuchskuhlense]|uniref:TonB-dependent receptor n=2 Tax=Novosphingobium fuchskuhlense TaxID=1117702 RepID=A0A117UXG9_9SPHN|nr:TonB-dependent receptor [Novosphingobium fuchskuhlense]